MSLSHTSLLLVRAAEEAEEFAVSPVLVGGVTFFILMFLLGVLVSIGGGRDHS